MRERRAGPARVPGSVGALLLTFVASGCASGGARVPPPEQIPALEQRVESHPADVTAMARLGAGYQAQGRLAEAESVLQRALEVDSENADAVFFLGLVYEDQEKPGEAIDLYERYLHLGAPGGMEDRIRDRIRLLRRQELRMAVRDALAREAELATTPPEPRTVAVFPFRFVGGDESFSPLSRALAEMLSTDLSQTDRLSVLERVRVQALVDEMSLAESGMVDPGTAARGGRLLGAGRIVQGQIQGDQSRLRMEAAVVDVARADREMAPVAQENEAAQLFAMEKELAFQIYESLGIPLTAAERERVSRRFTENIQALLAYGRGLEASDAGRYQEARQHFQEAVSLDPDFSQAEEQAEEAGELASAEATTTAELAQVEVRTTADLDLARQVEAMARQATVREPAQEALGSEGVARTGTAVRIIFKRPGGDQ